MATRPPPRPEAIARAAKVLLRYRNEKGRPLFVPKGSEPTSAPNTTRISIAPMEAFITKTVRGPDGKPLPLFATYSPSPPYLLSPCQVISLPVKGSASSDTK